MQIAIAGHHIEVTPAIHDAVHNKFGKVHKHYPDLNSLNVILNIEGREQKIEVNTSYLGTSMSVHAGNDDLYAAIASAAKKLEAALSHRKGSIKAGRHTKPELLVEETEVEEA